MLCLCQALAAVYVTSSSPVTMWIPVSCGDVGLVTVSLGRAEGASPP